MQFISQFLSYLKANHHSKSSQENYYYILIRAKKYFEGKGITDEHQITEHLAFEYIKYVENEIKSNWIHLRSVIYLNTYFNYLEEEKIIFINPMRNIEAPKEIRIPTKVMTQKKIRENLEKIDTNNDAGIRLKTILELLYSSALRPGEVPNLELSDIDFKKQTIFIHLAKNKKDRIVPVGKIALKWLNKYITEVRPKYLKNKSSPFVFIAHNRTGKKINYPGLYYLISINLKRNNIEHFKPHSLRTSSATHLLQNGMSILYI
ncbi:MAG: tyrosine-type recombinase/integrase, partial [Spirochaetes bacterium]|nr:tyrosine-type recombinase/integrase [Spirochaetota bacterium]